MEPCTGAVELHKRAPGAGFVRSRIKIRAIDAVMRVAEKWWHTKIAAELAARAHVSQRTCEFWISRKHNLSGDALANLLRSDAGFAVLEELMGEARPSWWSAFKAQVERAEVRRDIDRAIRRLKALDQQSV